MINFLLWGQLESLSLNMFFIPLFKILPIYEVFWYLIFANLHTLLLKFFAEIILIVTVDLGGAEGGNSFPQ